MKSKILFLSVALVLLACGLTPSPKSPAPGWYCIEVEGLNLPGAPALCWDTQAAMLSHKAEYEAQGRKVTVR